MNHLLVTSIKEARVKRKALEELGVNPVISASGAWVSSDLTSVKLKSPTTVSHLGYSYIGVSLGDIKLTLSPDTDPSVARESRPVLTLSYEVIDERSV